MGKICITIYMKRRIIRRRIVPTNEENPFFSTGSNNRLQETRNLHKDQRNQPDILDRFTPNVGAYNNWSGTGYIPRTDFNNQNQNKIIPYCQRGCQQIEKNNNRLLANNKKIESHKNEIALVSIGNRRTTISSRRTTVTS